MKSRWTRLLPIMLVTYLIAFLDRTNIGFGIPYMETQLHLGASLLGFASGILFVGYMVTQPLGGWLCDRGHAKRLVAILIVAWGVTEMAQALVTNGTELVVIRLLLGVAEGGIYPAFLVVIGNWFTQRERARALGLWQICYPIAAAITGPISGYIIQYDGWRMMFLVEGALPIVWVIAWLWGVASSPSLARWLKPADRQRLTTMLAAEQEPTLAVERAGSRPFWLHLRRPSTIMLSVATLLWNVGFLGFVIWLPSVLEQASKLSAASVGWLTALPYIVSMGALVGLTIISDRTLNRRLWTVLPMVVAALALLIGASLYTIAPLWLAMVLLCLAAAGIYGVQPVLWSIPSALLPREVAGAVMGVINGIGVIGAFGGPYVVGYARSISHDFSSGLVAMGVCLALSAALVLVVPELRRGHGRLTPASSRGIEPTVIAGES